MIRTGVVGLLLVALSGASAGQQVGDNEYLLDNGFLRVPLTITDNSGVERIDWPVTSGIPLPAGAVTDMDRLALVDEHGQQIPAQFTALSRYTARDNSVRWLLMDFQVSIEPNSTTQVFLTNYHRLDPDQHKNLDRVPPVVVTEHGGVLMLDTGPLQATVSARDGRIFDNVVVGGEQIISSEHFGSPYIRSKGTEQFMHFSGRAWNTHGWEHDAEIVERTIREQNYFGKTDAAVIIEERGPLRTTLRIRGTHRPDDRDHTLTDRFYNYTLRLHFYAGKAFVKVQLDIENSATEQPQWNFPFLDAGLLQRTALQPGSRVTAGFLDPESGQYEFVAVTLNRDKKIRLQQGKPGVAKRPESAAHRSKAELLSIGTDGQSKILGNGKIARFLDVSDDKKGLTLGIRYFWQEGPRAIEVADGMVKIITLANEFGTPSDEEQVVYDLDFGQRYINDLLLYFHGPATSQRAMQAVVEAFEYPLVAVAPTAWYADTEAWYFEVDKTQAVSARKASRPKHWIPADPVAEFRRDRDDYNSGGHHESLNSSWLSFLLSGSLSDFERLEVVSRWHIARNPGWAYRDNVIESKTGGNVLKEVDRKLLKWDRLAGFGRKNFYVWQGQRSGNSETGKKSYFNNYKQLPDMEHYANFILFEYYYLTGDKRALDAIHGFVNWALNFQHRHLFEREIQPLSEYDYFAQDPEAMRRGHYARVYSWMLYSTLAGFHATGSPAMDHFAIWQIRRALSLLRHRHGQFTSWDVKPGILLAPFNPDLQRKITDRFDYPLISRRESVYSSSAKSWMEAQNVLAFHEAYKTYQDERILDALWGMADYFAHQLIFYPQLGAFTRTTGMPTPRLNDFDLVEPRLHDRHIQALPILYHYSGWKDLGDRYDRVKEVTADRRINRWFSQTRGWEETTQKKYSSSGPERITDLEVINLGDNQFTLRWTSPSDDGPIGRASRYFVKVSDKPIVEFAVTDNPLRAAEKARIVNEVERALIASGYKPGNLDYSTAGIDVAPESHIGELADPKWHESNAFWMAEHVDGEPVPQKAGNTERFVVRHLNLHNWFGSVDRATLSDFESDKLYVAICSWDRDKNLSELSNVVAVGLH